MLKNITIEQNCEGVTGGAVGYDCPPGEMTVARFVRSKGKYFMHLGLANAVEITAEIKSKFHYGAARILQSTWELTSSFW